MNISMRTLYLPAGLVTPTRIRKLISGPNSATVTISGKQLSRFWCVFLEKCAKMLSISNFVHQCICVMVNVINQGFNH
ncbi:hypothetical protein CEXT_86021, partial [Caerostris extrusa]